MPFQCSICGEESTRICARCTKDACDNHLCDKCYRCSDCCECEVALSPHAPESVRAVMHPETPPMTAPLPGELPHPPIEEWAPPQASRPAPFENAAAAEPWASPQPAPSAPPNDTAELALESQPEPLPVGASPESNPAAPPEDAGEPALEPPAESNEPHPEFMVPAEPQLEIPAEAGDTESAAPAAELPESDPPV